MQAFMVVICGMRVGTVAEADAEVEVAPRAAGLLACLGASGWSPPRPSERYDSESPANPRSSSMRSGT
jgi:hypothetical protein